MRVLATQAISEKQDILDINADIQPANAEVLFTNQAVLNDNALLRQDLDRAIKDVEETSRKNMALKKEAAEWERLGKNLSKKEELKRKLAEQEAKEKE